jgi:WS/DGAT/MGAT family acyltransferase
MNTIDRPMHPMSAPRRMAPTDALFWYAETALPIFRPIIGGLFILDRAPDPQALEESLDAALALMPRLRQHVIEAPLHLGLPEWADDPHFDRSYHFRHLALPAPGTRRELLDLTATILATPLDRERPLWESYWIDGLEGGRSAFFMKVHHSVVDGVGAIALLGALTQGEGKGVIQVAVEEDLRRRRAPPGVVERLTGLALDNLREASQLAWRAAGAPLRFAANPAESLERVARTARGLRGIVQDLSKPPVRDPLAEGTSGLSRRLDVMELPLERLRKIKAPLGVTLNDLVLAVLAGTLGAYHRERGVAIEKLNCMVPMNLRGSDEWSTLGNRVGTFNIVLPVAQKRPEARLARIVEQARAAKEDQRGAAAPFLLQPLALIPGAAFRWLARNSLGRVNVACTNIPGVRHRRYMAGAAVEAIYPFASVVEGTPVVVALLSYAERFEVGFDTDPEAIPDPHRIPELFSAGIDEMESLSSHPPA